MTERLDEHKMKYAVDVDREAEKICRWAAARAGVIVVVPGIGTMTLMANEVYMITRLAELRGVKLSESAIFGFLGSLGGTFVGQTLTTLIPFAPLQVPVGISVTYAVGKVANAWLEQGQPKDVEGFKEVFEQARKDGLAQLSEFKGLACRNTPLGDEGRRFDKELQGGFDKLTQKADDLGQKIEETLNKILK